MEIKMESKPITDLPEVGDQGYDAYWSRRMKIVVAQQRVVKDMMERQKRQEDGDSEDITEALKEKYQRLDRIARLEDVLRKETSQLSSAPLHEREKRKRRIAQFTGMVETEYLMDDSDQDPGQDYFTPHNAYQEELFGSVQSNYQARMEQNSTDKETRKTLMAGVPSFDGGLKSRNIETVNAFLYSFRHAIKSYQTESQDIQIGLLRGKMGTDALVWMREVEEEELIDITLLDNWLTEFKLEMAPEQTDSQRKIAQDKLKGLKQSASENAADYCHKYKTLIRQAHQEEHSGSFRNFQTSLHPDYQYHLGLHLIQHPDLEKQSLRLVYLAVQKLDETVETKRKMDGHQQRERGKESKGKEQQHTSIKKVVTTTREGKKGESEIERKTRQMEHGLCFRCNTYGHRFFECPEALKENEGSTTKDIKGKKEKKVEVATVKSAKETKPQSALKTKASPKVKEEKEEEEDSSEEDERYLIPILSLTNHSSLKSRSVDIRKRVISNKESDECKPLSAHLLNKMPITSGKMVEAAEIIKGDEAVLGSVQPAGTEPSPQPPRGNETIIGTISNLSIPLPSVIIRNIGGKNFTSGRQMTFAAKANHVKATVLVDSGADENIIGPSLAHSCKARIELLKRPIDVEFANRSRSVIKERAWVEVKIGSWTRSIPFLICEVGHQMILGIPFFMSIVTRIDWKERRFDFKEHHQSAIIHKLRGLSIINKIKRGEERRKSATPTTQASLNSRSTIATISIQALRRLKKTTRQIYSVDVSEIIEEEGGLAGYTEGKSDLKLPPDATARDPNIMKLLQPHAREVVMSNPDIFDEPKELPPKREEDIKIEVKPGSKAPKMKGLGRVNERERVLLKKALTKLLESGKIRVSSSEYGARVLFIKKADGTMRMCIDYRDLNAITIRNRCPIPNIADMRGSVKGAKFFTKIDFRDGYYNLRVSEESIHRTAFRCRHGLFEFTVMPFGLTNAPAAFSAMMNRLFGDLFDIYVISYLDDLIIYSQNEEDHSKHVKEVFDRLRKNKLYLKLSKCAFFQSKVEFCGHIISGEGIEVAQSKVKAIQTLPEFRSRKDIEKFLGVMVWFQDFVLDYAAITAPITDLLRKEERFEWGEKQDLAARTLIDRITTAPILKYFDPDRQTKVFADASDYAIGGWIAQLYGDQWHPVVFVSRKMRPAELNYQTPEKELLALLYVLEKQGHYLRGGLEFEINTDCESLTFLQTLEHLSRRQSRWIMLLADYNMTIKHISGAMNNVADYLSRSSVVAPICHKCKNPIKIFSIITASIEGEEWKKEYAAACQVDRTIQKVRAWQKNKEKGSASDKFFFKQFELMKDTWWFGKRRFIPASPDNILQLQILQKYHDNLTAGHQGSRRTSNRITRLYYWVGMESMIGKYTSSCVVCQKNSERSTLLPGELHPLPIPTDRFRDVSIDFAKVTMGKDGLDMIMVIVCRLTKLVVLVPCKSSVTAAGVAQLFIKHWYCRGYGLPATIVSDRDSKFRSEVWQELTKKLGIQLELSTARHQQADGQSEIAIRTYKRTAKKFASWMNMDWADRVTMIEFVLNNSISATTGYTPFYLALGFHPRVFPEEYGWVLEGGEKEQRGLLTLIGNSMLKARQAMLSSQEDQKVQYDKRRSHGPTYKAGDLVMLESTGVNWPSFKLRPTEAIPTYYGPLEVVKVDKERDNVEIQLPEDMAGVHPVFHSSKLKRYQQPQEFFPTRSDGLARPEPVAVNIAGRELFEVDKIMDGRIYRKQKQYLVHFKGYPDDHGEWQTFHPSKKEEWKEEWALLQEFDPTIGNYGEEEIGIAAFKPTHKELGRKSVPHASGGERRSSRITAK